MGRATFLHHVTASTAFEYVSFLDPWTPLAACHYITLRDGARGAYSALQNRLPSSLCQLHGFQRECRTSKIQLVKLLGTVEVSTCHIFAYFAHLVFRLKAKEKAKARQKAGYCMLLFVHADGLMFTHDTGEASQDVSSSFIRIFIPEFVWKAYAWMDSGDEGDDGSEGQQLARA